ncbi:MAG: caspase family protein [Deltaproteobacteria bacterium]|nr:caspase family protein [Deltaproteobacteria bacterium]
MHSMHTRIFFTLFIIVLIFPSLLLAATEQRTALVIGNSAYSSGPLKNPVNDATDMAATLKKLGFKVVLKKNANLETMEGAIEEFGNRLKKGGVGLFYYAGHGVQVNGVNYLIPIGAKINKESDVRFKAFDAGRILAEMENANNGLNIVLLDACRDNPFGKSFRSVSRGLAIVNNAPTGTFISYSTSPGQVAKDGDGRNSPYTSALLQYMQQPDIPINDVFMKVRQNVRKSTGQTPWELSSLEGNFYFNQGQAVKRVEKETVQEASADLENEQQKITTEREKMRQERELFELRKALAEEQRKLEEERKQFAMAKRSSVPTAKEIKRDGRFIAYDNGTVLDTKTNLMWAARDNGSNINWYDANKYCKNYRGGGYSDWRLPTGDELVALEFFDKRGGLTTDTIKITDTWMWTPETRGSEAAIFSLLNKQKDYYWRDKNYPSMARAHPVRSLTGNEAVAIAIVERPFVPKANEIRRDGRFIAYDDGTVLDTRTNLIWAAKDNGSDINLADANSYWGNYRVGGYTDWRMPTRDELVGLYDSKTELIKLTDSYMWNFYPSLPTNTGEQSQFSSSGKLSGIRRVKGGDWLARVLPVRSAK